MLLNPLAVPPGVGLWLRDWERRLRVALRQLDAETPSRQVPAWDEAMAELRGMDPDAPGSVFRLLLERPLWQLADGSSARETFDRYGTTVLERVDAARALLAEIEPLIAERAAIIAEFGERFPNRLAEQLRRVRARDADIARLRRSVDAIRMRVRLDRARYALTRLSAAVADIPIHASSTQADGTTPERADRVAEGESETLPEMLAALEIARGMRRQLELHSSALREHRGQLAAQLRGLARSAPAADTTSAAAVRLAGHTPAVLERIINAAAAAGGSLEGRDAPAWTGALSASLAAHFPGLNRFTWLPVLLATDRNPGTDAPPPLPDAGLLHVVPVGAELLYLSPQPESAVRVRTRTIRIGEGVECQVAPDMVARHAPGLVDADVRALFDGLEGGGSRWYATRTRASARVIARHGDGWFARLGHRGEISTIDQPAWHVDAPGSAFRVLRAAPAFRSAPPPADQHQVLETVMPTREAPHAAFMGFTLREVRTGLLGDEHAWARGVGSAWSGAPNAVRREAELFARLHAAHARGTPGDVALRPLSWARLPDERDPVPIYRAPMATLDAPARLRSWIAERESHFLAAITGIARIIAAVHASGFAVGICHSEAFAYGIAWAPDPLTPVPAPILAHAPGATPIGQPYAPPAATSMSPAYYTMLRTPVLVPNVAAGQAATAERDMQAFGAFVLDLLLEQPIFPRGTLDWYDAPGVVRARASQCSTHPTVAKYLGDLIHDPLGWRRIGDMHARLAAGKVRKIAELL